jgi:hypothetical protein
MHADEPRPSHRFCATVDLRVPRGEPGSLHEGVSGVLERIEHVRSAMVVSVSRVHPKSADLYVSAVVSVSVGDVDSCEVRSLLADGFGILDVRGVTAEASGVDHERRHPDSVGTD